MLFASGLEPIERPRQFKGGSCVKQAVIIDEVVVASGFSVESILQLTEGCDGSFAAQHFSKSIQRDHERDIGLSIACDIG